MSTQRAHTRWTPRPVRIALVQCAFDTEPRVNLATALEWLQKVAEQKADVVCPPELFRTAYFCTQKSCPPSSVKGGGSLKAAGQICIAH